MSGALEPDALDRGWCGGSQDSYPGLWKPLCGTGAGVWWWRQRSGGLDVCVIEAWKTYEKHTRRGPWALSDAGLC